MDNMIIGNTPLIKIYYEYNNKIKYIYTKLEYYNFTGSIKDRVALYMINNAKKKRRIKRKYANNRSNKWKHRNITCSIRKYI